MRLKLKITIFDIEEGSIRLKLTLKILIVKTEFLVQGVGLLK